MPVTATWVPILSQFLCVVEKTTGMQVPPTAPEEPSQSVVRSDDLTPKKLPKGVVLGKDGKPCRSCTSVASWMAMTKSQNPTSQKSSSSAVEEAPLPTQLPEGCPPDVETLGRNTWSLLHSMTATYPKTPTPAIQQQTKTFISSFANLYPCSHCAEDFRQWMKEDGNAPRLGSRRDFGEWMCDAHNAVNVKLGKKKFDCFKWEERWRTGPPDGRCG